MPIIERRRADGSTAYLAQIDIRRKGKRYRDAQTFDNERTAKAWIKKRTKEIDQAIANGEAVVTRAQDRTLKAAIDHYSKDSGTSVGKTKRQVLETLRDE